MGAHEPLYRGCPAVPARPTQGRARVSLVRNTESPPTSDSLLVGSLPERGGAKRKCVVSQRPTWYPPTSPLTTAETSSCVSQ